MVTDRQIADSLTALALTRVPFGGRWNRAPFPDLMIDGRPFAVLADDPQVQALTVSRDTGAVMLVDADIAEPELVNKSLAQFVASVRVYVNADNAAGHIDETDYDALEDNSVRALAAIRTADPDAVRDKNQFWWVAAEELGYAS